MGKAVDKLKRAKQLIYDAMIVGGREYAVGRQDGSKPIVDQHFTTGNQQRYGWEPLSRAYFLRKQGTISGQGMKSGRFHGSQLDKKAEFSSSTGTLRGIGSAMNLPMLVLTGTLRKAVTSKEATVHVQGSNIVVTFRGLPGYAVYLHEGTGKMPKRSPVEPNAQDRQEVIDAMRRFIQRASGTGGAVAVSQNDRFWSGTNHLTPLTDSRVAGVIR